jgi:hypothetical protein
MNEWQHRSSPAPGAAARDPTAANVEEARQALALTESVLDDFLIEGQSRARIVAPASSAGVRRAKISRWCHHQPRRCASVPPLCTRWPGPWSA